MTATLPVHPFPARMAPELALDRLPRRLDSGLRVLDPMMGSGTIPVIAAQQGYAAIGFDSDPLAVIIARTNGQALDPTSYRRAVDDVVDRARGAVGAPWKHQDSETQEFIDFWFDPVAQRQLGALASAIRDAPESLHNALWCAFSRLIITKDAGASRARDVSHSRPHRVRDAASFDPIERLGAAAGAVVKRHQQVGRTRPAGERLRLQRGDARDLPLKSSSVDVVMTSPPYLQAIDYLRGHRLSLVWMGHTIGELRRLRATSIGTERGSDPSPRYQDVLVQAAGDAIGVRDRRVIAKYVTDLGTVMDEVARVLKPHGTATFVVADATMRGQRISISDITSGVAKLSGLALTEHVERSIPAANRYLPPPRAGGTGALDKRMRTEHCLTFVKANTSG